MREVERVEDGTRVVHVVTDDQSAAACPACGVLLSSVRHRRRTRALLATARTGGQRHDVAHRLHRFNSWCATSGLPELKRLAATIEAWWPEVLGFLQTGITNAGTEATNRTVKTAAHRLRLPQSGQPMPPSTVRLHPAPPSGHRLLKVSLPLKFEEPGRTGPSDPSVTVPPDPDRMHLASGSVTSSAGARPCGPVPDCTWCETTTACAWSRCRSGVTPAGGRHREVPVNRITLVGRVSGPVAAALRSSRAGRGRGALRGPSRAPPRAG